MHKEILSEKERMMLQNFIANDKQSDSFYVLKHRIKSYHEKLHSDLNLIDSALKKFEKSSN
jgi:hypothetical protein